MLQQFWNNMTNKIWATIPVLTWVWNFWKRNEQNSEKMYSFCEWDIVLSYATPSEGCRDTSKSSVSNPPAPCPLPHTILHVHRKSHCSRRQTDLYLSFAIQVTVVIQELCKQKWLATSLFTGKQIKFLKTNKWKKKTLKNFRPKYSHPKLEKTFHKKLRNHKI